MIETKITHVAEKITPAHDKTEIAHISCDLCGSKTKDKDKEVPDWTGKMYTVDTTSIARRTGDDFGGDGCSIDWQIFHICPECWSSKLVPWMISQGAKMTESNDCTY